MNKGCWKFDEQNKALYVDIDDDDAVDNKHDTYSAWDCLPDLLLEEIFSLLTIRERYYASLVCKSWYRAFKLPRVWSRFILQDTTLTRGKYNYYSGWCYVLDHMRTSICFYKVGRHFRSLVIEPMFNFNNLYEFMNMMTWFSERRHSSNIEAPGIGENIHHLKFTFPCNMANNPEHIKIFGTGGKLLEALVRLADNFHNLKSLEFIDLMLDNREALYFLDGICNNCTETLSNLVLINTSKSYCPLLHAGIFINLNFLTISPQNLDENVLELLGYTKLREMHIVQNRYSPIDTTIQLPKHSAWIKLRKNNPKLKVHFEIESVNPQLVLPFTFPEHSAIPCYSIVIENPIAQPSGSMILAQAVNFQSTLSVYAIKGLSKYYLDRTFSKRLDEVIVRLCETCPNIQTLMIREKISTATILEIVSTAKSLKFLYVRRNAVLKRCDKAWSAIACWTSEHEEWIKTNCNSYESTENAVSQILGYPWHMLSEREFKNQSINVRI